MSVRVRSGGLGVIGLLAACGGPLPPADLGVDRQALATPSPLLPLPTYGAQEVPQPFGAVGNAVLLNGSQGLWSTDANGGVASLVSDCAPVIGPLVTLNGVGFC